MKFIRQGVSRHHAVWDIWHHEEAAVYYLFDVWVVAMRGNPDWHPVGEQNTLLILEAIKNKDMEVDLDL